MVTYKEEYFMSPWNYMDMASCVIISILFLLHITRLNQEVRMTCLFAAAQEIINGIGGHCLVANEQHIAVIAVSAAFLMLSTLLPLIRWSR